MKRLIVVIALTVLLLGYLLFKTTTPPRQPVTTQPNPLDTINSYLPTPTPDSHNPLDNPAIAWPKIK